MMTTMTMMMAHDGDEYYCVSSTMAAIFLSSPLKLEI